MAPFALDQRKTNRGTVGSAATAAADLGGVAEDLGLRHRRSPSQGPRREGQGRPFPALSTRYSTASPLNGGVNAMAEDPPVTGLPAVTAPVDGFSHSTLSTCVVAERFTVKPPEPA